MKLFKYYFFLLFLYKCHLNETFDQSLADLYLINHLTNYRANRVHKNEATYELFKEFKNFHKFNIYDLYSTHITLYSSVLNSYI